MSEGIVMESARSVRRRQTMMRWTRKFSTLSPVEIYGLISVGFLLFLALIGPHITPYPAQTADPSSRLLPPSQEHWLGTDENGMDVFSRILAAPRVDVSVAFIGIFIAVIVGTPIGVFAGYFEGSDRRLAAIIGESILRILDAIQAFPVFILAMVLVAIRGATTENIIIAIAFVNMPTFLRLARAEILSLRHRPYSEAARSIGAKDRVIAFRHLLPNALPPLIAQVSVTMGFAILLTAGLSFVGAGVQPPTPELGGMISTGARMMIIGHWWPSLFPGIALGIIVFSFASGGQALERLLRPYGTDAEGAAARGEDSSDNSVAISDNTSTIEHMVAQPAERLLSVSNLSVEFDASGGRKRVLQGISLWVAPGETLGIVGESGSGKSILIRAILGLLPEDGRVATGEVLFQGRALLEMSVEELRRLRGVALAPILPNAKDQLSPVTRIADLLVMGYRAHVNVERRTALKKAVEALRAVGIQDPARRLSAYPHELSGGMAQRVCIALALMHDPELLVADEPTAGLDVTVQRQVLDQLVSATQERDAAQLIVTRDLGIVAQFCLRIAVMQGGRIVETGYTEDIFRNPRHQYTRQLLSTVQYTDVQEEQRR